MRPRITGRLQVMNIQELAAEKVTLEMRLQAMGMINVNGMDIQHRIELEVNVIETRKRINELRAEIFSYENTNRDPRG